MTDSVPPTVTITSDATRLSQFQKTKLTFTLSEPSVNFTVGDVTIYGGTLSDFSGGGTVYTADYTGQFTGFVSVPNKVFTDFEGNANEDGAEENNTIKLVVNQAPVSNIFPKQYAKAGVKVTLNGKGSNDPNGDELSYRWAVIVKPTGSTPVLTNQISAQPEFVSDYVGTYVLTLVVNDELLSSAISMTTVFVTSPSSAENFTPIADAGPKLFAKAGEMITLNGKNSSDPNGDQLNYSWVVIGRPIGGTAVLERNLTDQPSFSADLAGRYYISLVVNDGQLNSEVSATVVEVSFPNSAPIANAGSSQNLEIGRSTLDGSASFDRDGDTLLYKWYLVSKPSNSKANLTWSSTSKPILTTDIAGEYVITLVVSYGKEDSAPATTLVTAFIPFIRDIIPPFIKILADTNNMRPGNPIKISFYLSEPSSNFELSDVIVTGGILSDWAGFGDSYSALFTPHPNSTTNGIVSIKSLAFTDAAGNFNVDGLIVDNTIISAVDSTVAIIFGTVTADILSNSIGNESIYGSDGIDTVVVSKKISNYSVNKTSSGYALVDKYGADGTDTLVNVEIIKFIDMTINLTVQAKAASAPKADVTRLVEVYTAFFNRVPDADGMSFWIDEMKSGKTIHQIAEAFYKAGVNYSNLTGFSSTMTNADFINVIFKNVLGRNDGADPGGLSFWEAEITSGRASRGTLITNILDSAHTFKSDATWGWVADLLDNKITVAKKFSIDMGLNYNTPEESITKGMAIASAITPTDTTAAITLIGVNEANLILFSQ